MRSIFLRDDPSFSVTLFWTFLSLFPPFTIPYVVFEGVTLAWSVGREDIVELILGRGVAYLAAIAA